MEWPHTLVRSLLGEGLGGMKFMTDTLRFVGLEGTTEERLCVARLFNIQCVARLPCTLINEYPQER